MIAKIEMMSNTGAIDFYGALSQKILSKKSHLFMFRRGFHKYVHNRTVGDFVQADALIRSKTLDDKMKLFYHGNYAPKNQLADVIFKFTLDHE
ncbi:MAG: hypothetical protein HKP38_03440 [Croceitalea sp.]|nr:hypothetical protein [Croceitalea sp.]NNL08256.1 hypothetical protein [Croceitalea sp.]